MDDKELNELLEYNQEYMEARLSEDIFGGDYTSEVELKHLKKDYDKLHSNWNSLRVLLINEKKMIEEEEFFCNLSNKDYIQFILDKINELEGKDKE